MRANGVSLCMVLSIMSVEWADGDGCSADRYKPTLILAASELESAYSPHQVRMSNHIQCVNVVTPDNRHAPQPRASKYDCAGFVACVRKQRVASSEEEAAAARVLLSFDFHHDTHRRATAPHNSKSFVPLPPFPSLPLSLETEQIDMHIDIRL